MGFLGGSLVKNLPACAGDAVDPGLIPGLGRAPGGNGNPLQYSHLEKFHGQRSLAGCSPWGLQELDMIQYTCYIYIVICRYFAFSSVFICTYLWNQHPEQDPWMFILFRKAHSCPLLNSIPTREKHVLITVSCLFLNFMKKNNHPLYIPVLHLSLNLVNNPCCCNSSFALLNSICQFLSTILFIIEDLYLCFSFN